MKLENPFIYDDFSSGMIDDAAVSDSLMPRNAVRKAINCVFDTPRGAISERLGSILLGVSLATQVQGLYNFRDAGAGTNHQLITTDNIGKTYYFDSGTTFSVTLTGDTVALKTRFVTFLDRVARLNGTDGVKSWTGAVADSWITTGSILDVGNWPSGTKYAKVFNSRVYAAGATSAPDTLYYSSIPSASTISWTSGNGSLDVNPNDGENGITALETNGTILMVFKQNSLYRWDGFSTFANKVINVGTSSQESVALHDSGWVYFFGIGKGGVGAYRTTGGYPQKISLNINKWFEAISASNYANVAGFCDDDHFSLYVGSVTVNNETYSNAIFVYTISTQSWHIEDRGFAYNVFATYRDSTDALTIVGGDTSGRIQTINSGNDDIGSPINSECEFAPLVFTTRSRTKQLGGITAYATNFTGLQLLIKTDQKDYAMLGDIKSTEQNFPSPVDGSELFRGKRFFPKIVASNTSTPFQFDGFEFQDVMDEGFKQ